MLRFNRHQELTDAVQFDLLQIVVLLIIIINNNKSNCWYFHRQGRWISSVAEEEEEEECVEAAEDGSFNTPMKMEMAEWVYFLNGRTTYVIKRLRRVHPLTGDLNSF